MNNADITDYKIDISTTEESFMFVNCRIKEMKISVKTPKKIVFLNCNIFKLTIDNSYVTNLKFICCEIEESTFQNSVLPRLVFSAATNAPSVSSFKKYIETENKSSITNSSFLFCQLNHLTMEQTNISNSNLKHCIIEEMEIKENVKFENVDIRGSKFTKANWGTAQMSSTTFSKRFFLSDFGELLIGACFGSLFFPIDRIRLWLRSPGRFSLKKKQMRGKRELKKNIVKACSDFRYKIKKELYKLGLWPLKKILDSCAPSLFKDTISYTNADMSKDNLLFWYFEDMEHIEKLKERSVGLALISYIFVGYMHSIKALLIRVFIYTTSCALFFVYSAKYKPGFIPFSVSNFQQLPWYKKLLEGLNLSLRVYLGAEKTAIESGNIFTEIIILFEKFYGYVSLGALLAIILYYFSRPTALSQKK